MANGKRHEGYESSILAAALAVAGVLFLFDKLGVLMRHVMLSAHAGVHLAPAFLAGVAMCLIMAERGAGNGSEPDRPEGRGSKS
jgi:hypothetical protein